MEIIKCKGKSLITKEWVFGYPIKDSKGSTIIFTIDEFKQIPILPGTLCYSTGEDDINGRELFIGDTINDFGGGTHVVDTDSESYHPSQAFPPTKVEGDTTRLGNIIFKEGTVKIKTSQMSYAYNLSSASKLSEMEYYDNIWD